MVLGVFVAEGQDTAGELGDACALALVPEQARERAGGIDGVLLEALVGSVAWQRPSPGGGQRRGHVNGDHWNGWAVWLHGHSHEQGGDAAIKAGTGEVVLYDGQLGLGPLARQGECELAGNSHK